MFTLCITHWRFRSQFCLCNGDFGNQSPVPVTLCTLLVSASLLLSTGPRNSRLFVQDGHRQAAMLKNERQVTIGAVTLGKARPIHFRFLESDQARCENSGFQTHVWQKMERPRRSWRTAPQECCVWAPGVYQREHLLSAVRSSNSSGRHRPIPLRAGVKQRLGT